MPDLAKQVVKTYPAQGDMQLFRLAATTEFVCSRCQQTKTAKLVAVVSGDWAPNKRKGDRMSYYLYQMSAYDPFTDDNGVRQDGWRPRNFRADVCEGQVVEWAWYKRMSAYWRGQGQPTAGDAVILYFSPGGLEEGEEPGV